MRVRWTHLVLDELGVLERRDEHDGVLRAAHLRALRRHERLDVRVVVVFDGVVHQLLHFLDLSEWSVNESTKRPVRGAPA